MKRTIRWQTFETNSSTSHVLVILPDHIYKKWEENEELYIYDGYTKKENPNWPKADTLYTFEEVKNFVINVMGGEESYFGPDENEDNVVAEYGFYTFRSWNDDESDYCLEEDTTPYTTESGDEIMIRAKYGWNG